MALAACKECGKPVSSQAAACPHCGHPTRDKANDTAVGILVKAVLVVVIVAAFAHACDSEDHSNSVESPAPAEEPTRTPAATPAPAAPPELTDVQCRKDLDCITQRDMPEAVVACKPLIEAQSHFEVKWNDGWLTPMFDRRAWESASHMQIVYVGDKVEFQNAFHAFAPVTYYCTFDLTTKTATAIYVEPVR